MRYDPKSNEAVQPAKKSLLAPVILAISAVAHVALLGYAALLPPPAETPEPNVRVQVTQWQQDETNDTWASLGTRWALVSREKLNASAR